MPFDFYCHYELVKKRPDEFRPSDMDDSLLPAQIVIDPIDEFYNEENQLQRTVNFGVCRTPGGRIFQSFFSSKDHNDENTGNWIMITMSDDDGDSFVNKVAVNPPNFCNTRVFEGVFWLDPMGRMWFFYVQTYRRMDGREGVWYIRCNKPDAKYLQFTAPKRLCDGIISAPPVVLSDGRWAFTSYLHHPSAFHGDFHNDFNTTDIIWMPEKIGISVHISHDKGKSFETIASGIKFPYATFYENCLVEKKDGTLWILIRGMNCTGQTISNDGGFTWSPAIVNGNLPLPNSHFTIGRLSSGNLLLVANYKANMFSYYVGRNNLTALISTDDGVTWGEHYLLLDHREGSEQPAFHECDNGFIYISYGRAPQIAGESLLAIITEDDILAGKLVNPKSRLKITTGRSTGMKRLEYYPQLVAIAQKHGIEL